MEKKYQVFVSSTFQDLQEERKEVMQALFELDCIPAGMELFPASDDEKWTLIKNVINDCDYYIVILAGRYGSTAADGMSYTEMEYRYALDINKPIIGFIHKDPDKIPTKYSEKVPERHVKLNGFRGLIQKKMCKEWESPADLGSKVSRSLVQLIKTHPATGWVRADQITNADEALKLRKRIDDLELELKELSTQAPGGTENLCQGDDQFLVQFSYSAGSVYDTYSESYDDEVSHTYEFIATWDDLYAYISPKMINEIDEVHLRYEINDFVKDQNLRILSKLPKFKNSDLYDFNINDSHFQTIKIQLRALGLITQSYKPRSVKDTSTYWTLTPYGDNIMTKLRAIKRT